MPGFVTSDNVALAVHELAQPDGRGGGSPVPMTALLAHAAGLCATVLAPLAEELAAALALHGFGYDARGHGASGRDPDGLTSWQRLGSDALAVVDSLPTTTPRLVGIGHSSGATALLLAEAARPGTFSQLFLYEPTVTLAAGPNPRGAALASATARRRNRFASREDAYGRFAARPPFSAVTPAALRAYVEDGLTPNGEDEFVLACRPEDEAALYRLGPCYLGPELVAAIGCPVFLGWGTTSRDPGREMSERLVEVLGGAAREAFPGLSHFGPLEDPRAVARWIIHHQ